VLFSVGKHFIKIIKPLQMRKIFLIPCIIFFFACKKNVSDPTSPELTTSQNNHLHERLIQLGFSASNIRDLGRYYLVEGDMLFDKEHTDMKLFEDYFKNQPKSTVDQRGQRHWITPGIVSNYNIEFMKMDISENMFGSEIYEWRKSSATAMTHWAGISNTNINFVRYPGSQNMQGSRFITVVDDAGVLPNNVIAAAEWPTSGNPGFRIRVNLDFLSNQTVSEGQRVYNLVHEIGHCIGFRHSDLNNNTEPVNGATPVTTTSAGIDNLSVMKAGTALNSWNGFSSNDIIAAQTVYPRAANNNWITSPNSGKYPAYSHYFILNYDEHIPVSWNASLVSTPTVTLEVYHAGVFKQVIASGIPNTGSYSYPFMEIVGGGSHYANEIQVKIISDANPAISDFSVMFDIVAD
jgi:hypothetical protein